MLRKEYDAIVNQSLSADEVERLVELVEDELQKVPKQQKRPLASGGAFNSDARKKVDGYLSRKKFNDEYGYLFDEDKY